MKRFKKKTLIPCQLLVSIRHLLTMGIAIGAMFCFTMCKNKPSPVKEGWCVVDSKNSIHIDRNCPYISDRICKTCTIEQFLWNLDNIDDMWYCVCRKCASPTKYLAIYKQMKEFEEKYIEKLKGDYNVLCQMGVNPWGEFEMFSASMKGDYYDKLKAVLLENGYCIEDFWNIENALGMRTVLKDDVYRDTCLVEWNECNIAWLYIGFREAGEFTGTFLDFKQSMKTKEGFLIYYNKSLELGIVDNWEAFLRMMIEPNEEKCIEWYWDDFLEELREDDEQIQNYYEEMQEYDREYYEEMQYSHH